MDTTEEANGTYFYHGSTNLTPGELLDIIFWKNSVTRWGLIPSLGLRSCRSTMVKDKNETRWGY